MSMDFGMNAIVAVRTARKYVHLVTTIDQPSYLIKVNVSANDGNASTKNATLMMPDRFRFRPAAPIAARERA